jgi:hypothetical protein
MASPHSFIAYIDEAGDEGFTFRDPCHTGSSHWFVLSAVVFRAQDELAAIRNLNAVIKPIELARKKPIHFSSLPHEQRVPIAYAISKSSLKLISVCIHKPALIKQHGLRENRRLYFWATRLLLERISWMVRAQADRRDGKSGRCGLVFSHCKRLSYDRLREYLRLLHSPQIKSQIDWRFVSEEDVEVDQHAGRVGLKVADAVASGLRYALDLSSHGFCEDRYARLFRSVTYCRGNNYLSYGLKVIPTAPQHEPHRDNRYRWIESYE